MRGWRRPSASRQWVSIHCGLAGERWPWLDLTLSSTRPRASMATGTLHQVRQRVEALSRALDITQSRYVLTVIFAGAALQGDVETLSATCRVLSVESISLDADDKPVNTVAAEALDDQIRVLLPLDVRPNEGEETSANGDTVGELLAALPKSLDKELVRSLATASLLGETAVTEALGRRLGEVLALEEDA